MSSAPIADLSARRSEPDAHHAAARGMFERIAPTYDVLNRILSAGTDRLWRARAVAEVLRAPRGAVLDLCAGTLDLAAAIAERRPLERIVAVDFSPAMLARGAHKAPRVEAIVADALHLPFDDRSFVAVVCGFGMRNLADLTLGLREVRRVLGPGGVFVTLELFRPSRVAARALHRVYASALLPAIGGLVSGDTKAYEYLARSMAGFVSRTEYEDALRGTGFSPVRGVDLTLGVASLVCAEAPA
jgi:ubiquinone/menaquinone biosynthesis methyltransferase